MRRRLYVAAALLLAAACGHKAMPVAPELVRPEPPASVTAASTMDGVRLSWLRPTRYSGGQRLRDLGSFRIERAPADETPPRWTRLGTVELQDQTRFRQERHFEWWDRTAVPGERYVYRVIARTLDGYDSAAAGPVSIHFAPPAGPTEPAPATP